MNRQVIVLNRSFCAQTAEEHPNLATTSRNAQIMISHRLFCQHARPECPHQPHTTWTRQVLFSHRSFCHRSLARPHQEPTPLHLHVHLLILSFRRYATVERTNQVNTPPGQPLQYESNRHEALNDREFNSST
jgi:hypothetical protein